MYTLIGLNKVCASASRVGHYGAIQMLYYYYYYYYACMYVFFYHFQQDKLKNLALLLHQILG